MSAMVTAYTTFVNVSRTPRPALSPSSSDVSRSSQGRASGARSKGGAEGGRVKAGEELGGVKVDEDPDVEILDKWVADVVEWMRAQGHTIPDPN